MDVKIVTNQQEKDDAFHVRRVVFIEEQGVPEDLELDEWEDTATHLVGYVNEEPVAASRLRFVEDCGKLERICVLKSERGNSYGQQMIRYMEQVIQERSFTKAKLNAQTHAESFYQSLGYETISGEFMDAGIPHVTMIKALPA